MRLITAVAVVFATVSGAAAQEFRGTITGRMNDRSGGVLPGVTVTATNVATNVASTTTTNSEGLFTIPYLTPGTYKVEKRFTKGYTILAAYTRSRFTERVFQLNPRTRTPIRPTPISARSRVRPICLATLSLRSS